MLLIIFKLPHILKAYSEFYFDFIFYPDDYTVKTIPYDDINCNYIDYFTMFNLINLYKFVYIILSHSRSTNYCSIIIPCEYDRILLPSNIYNIFLM